MTLLPVTAFFEGDNPASKVPATLSHCMLAVKKKGFKARASWNICRSSLMKSGHLKGPYRRDAKLDQSILQTQKGSRRSMKHGMERGGDKKFAKFSKMFRGIETGVVNK
jgi:hypothetical protein